MTSLDEHYMSLPEGTRAAGDAVPGMHRADRPWYRQRSLYARYAATVGLGATVAAAWVALALAAFGK